jgi:hypothetical protein
MSKAQHTPGPWKLISNGLLVQDAGNRLHIGTFKEAEGLGHSAAANARLIAAAPELLAALEEIVAQLGDKGYCAISKARAVAEKARGETI